MLYCIILLCCVLLCSILLCSVLFRSIASSNPTCWIMKVMPTRSLLPGTRCFGLSLCCDLFCPNCDAQIAQNQPKLCPNCSREKKKSHIFYSQDRNFYWKITVFLKKKNEKILETTKKSVLKTPCFFE